MKKRTFKGINFNVVKYIWTIKKINILSKKRQTMTTNIFIIYTHILIKQTHRYTLKYESMLLVFFKHSTTILDNWPNLY